MQKAERGALIHAQDNIAWKVPETLGCDGKIFKNMRGQDAEGPSATLTPVAVAAENPAAPDSP